MLLQDEFLTVDDEVVKFPDKGPMVPGVKPKGGTWPVGKVGLQVKFPAQ